MNLFRISYLTGFLICAALLGAAFYFEYVMYLDPCPLCMLQRIITAAVGLGCLLAFALDHFRWPTRFFAALATGFAIFGIFVSKHHLWLQSLPADQAPACGPGFYYLAETMPVGDLWNIMLNGDGNCAEVAWMFMGLSMPGWTLVFFTGFAIVGALTLLLDLRRKHRD